MALAEKGSAPFLLPESNNNVKSDGQSLPLSGAEGRVRPTRSVLHAVQGLSGGGVGVGQGQGGAEFPGCACAVALFFQHLSEEVVGFEGGAGFDGRLQVTSQQAL